MSRISRICALAVGAVLFPSGASAVDAISGASEKVHAPGATVVTWITGRGFSATVTIEIGGDGITVNPPQRFVAQADRVDGGLGDGILYGFIVSPDATPGPRALILRDEDGSEVIQTAGIIIEGAVVVPDPDGAVPDAFVAPSDGTVPVDANSPNADRGVVPDTDSQVGDGTPNVFRDRAVLRGVSSCDAVTASGSILGLLGVLLGGLLLGRRSR